VGREEELELTDGVPLFVEEMTKAVLEAESEAAVERTVAQNTVQQTDRS
jgi:predicted ATPase